MLDTNSKIVLSDVLSVELAEVVAVVTWVERKGETLWRLRGTRDKQYRTCKIGRSTHTNMCLLCHSNMLAFKELLKIKYLVRFFSWVKENNIIFQVTFFVRTTLHGIEMTILGVTIFGEHQFASSTARTGSTAGIILLFHAS